MRNILSSILLLLVALSTQAQSLPVPTSLPFLIYNTRTGENITITELADKMKYTDVLFWGEEHDDTIGHILQLKLLKLLRERHQEDNLILSMEMFETDCQVVLNEYTGGFINKEKFLKLSRPWNNYQDYEPLVEFAKQERIPVIAANSPRRYNNIMSSRGPKTLDSLGASSKKYIARLPVYAPKSGKYYKKFVNIMGGEDNIHSPNMFASQCLWDATMAESIQKAHKKFKKNGLVFHIAGRFHSDEYLGTVAQLERKNKDLNIRTISCFRAEDFDKPNYDQYAALADYIILIKKTQTAETTE